MNPEITQAELDLIAREAKKERKALIKAINHVRRIGVPPSTWWDESLSGCVLIYITGPNERNRYNHYEVDENKLCEYLAS
jgi:hypothetical protein